MENNLVLFLIFVSILVGYYIGLYKMYKDLKRQECAEIEELRALINNATQSDL